MRKRFAVTIALLAAVVAAGQARGQQPRTGGAVRGVVRDSDGQAIPYAVVALQPGYDQRFTDDSGRFLFQGVVPGTYRLLARQVGFRPGDTAVAVTAGVTRTFAIALDRLTVRLDEIRVVASAACTSPGPPDSALAPDLARVFYQLDLNADRYRLLAGTYPFHFRMERSFENYDSGDRVVFSLVDTVRYLSSAVPSYRPGEVVAWGRGRGNERSPVLNLPTLADFADSSFQANHCFEYAGIVDDSGASAVRFEFRPAAAIRYPDIEGWVDLDPATYQVRKAMVRLTRPARAIEGLADASSVITFAELYPNVVVQSRVESETMPVIQPSARDQIVRYHQAQRLVSVEFQRALPGRRPAAAPEAPPATGR